MPYYHAGRNHISNKHAKFIIIPTGCRHTTSFRCEFGNILSSLKVFQWKRKAQASKYDQGFLQS